MIMLWLILMRHMSDTLITIHIKLWVNKITHEVPVGIFFCINNSLGFNESVLVVK